MIEEIIYTSAQAGLKPGSRGFCTVESTHGMALNTAERLESMSGYRHAFPLQDPQAALNPICFSYMTLRIGGKPAHVVSRVADYGHDYSGRTNKLAHHILLDRAAMAPAGPARLMRQPGVLTTEWGGTVRNIPPRTLPAPALPKSMKLSAWKSLTGDSGWAGWVAEALQAEATPVSVIFAPGTDTLALVEEVFDLLSPPHRWEYTFCTYFTKALAGTTCQLRFVLDNTPEATALRNDARARLVDLTISNAPAVGGPLVALARETIVHAVAPAPGLPAATEAPPSLPTSRPALPGSVESTPPPAPGQRSSDFVPQIHVAETSAVRTRRKPRFGGMSIVSLIMLTLLVGIAAGYYLAGNREVNSAGSNLTADTDTPGTQNASSGNPKQGKSPQEKSSNDARSPDGPLLAAAGSVTTAPAADSASPPRPPRDASVPEALQTPRIPPVTAADAGTNPASTPHEKPGMEPTEQERPPVPEPQPKPEPEPFRLALQDPQYRDSHGQLRALLPDPATGEHVSLPLICEQDTPEITITPSGSFLNAINSCCNGVKVAYQRTSPESWDVKVGDTSPPEYLVARVRLQKTENSAAPQTHRLEFSWAVAAPDPALAAVLRWCPIEITVAGSSKACLLSRPQQLSAIDTSRLLEARYEQNDDLRKTFQCISILQFSANHAPLISLTVDSGKSTHELTTTLADGVGKLPVLAFSADGDLYSFDPKAPPPDNGIAFATLQGTFTRQDADAPDARFLIEPRWDAVIPALGLRRMQELDTEANRQARNTEEKIPEIFDQLTQQSALAVVDAKTVSATQLEAARASFSSLQQRLQQAQQLQRVRYWSREELKPAPSLHRKLEQVAELMRKLEKDLQRSSDAAAILTNYYTRQLRNPGREKQSLETQLTTAREIEQSISSLQDVAAKLQQEQDRTEQLEAAIAQLHQVAADLRIQLRIHANFFTDSGNLIRVDFLESAPAGEQQ